MPFYEYQCKSCGHTLEAMQKITAGPLKKCPNCGKPALTRLMSAPVFRLKGGGWYETDFKSDQDAKRNLADKPEADAAKEDKKDAKDGAAVPAAGKDDKKASDGAGDKPSDKAGEKAGAKSADKPAAKAPAAQTAKRTVSRRPTAKKPVKKSAGKPKRRR
jgi:putative FmdB family regulatory protein